MTYIGSASTGFAQGVAEPKREKKATVEHGWRLPLISTTDKSATAAGGGAATEATAATAGATAAAAKGTGGPGDPYSTLTEGGLHCQDTSQANWGGQQQTRPHRRPH